MRVILGDNTIDNCDGVLIVNGVEVFRLREGLVDGQLLVDFEVRDENDQLLAKVAKNKVVFKKDGYEVQHELGESRVTSPDSDQPVACVTRLSTSSVRVSGDFWIKGYHVVIREQGGILAGPVRMSGNRISGYGTAIVLEPGSLVIGCAEPPQQRH